MSLNFVKKAALAAGIVAAALGAAASAADQKQLTGAGSTAIYPVLSAWSDTYNKDTGIAVNYQSIGSGGGIQQIKSKTVNFGATDKPLKPEDLQANNLAQFPAIVIGITPVVNIPGVAPGQLVLNGEVLANIFLGKITNWSDKAIAALNPGLALPDSTIAVVHRADGSGTTFTFTSYLAKVSDEWSTKVGNDSAVSWPTGLGGKGNEGVASFVNQVKGSIGYVEFAYALQNKMTYTKLVNLDGKTVDPDLKSFQAASANADFSKVDGFYLILTNQPGADSWPITGATWVLLRTDGDKGQNQAVAKFFSWCLTKGQKQAQDLQYVPLTAKTYGLIEAYWKSKLGISFPHNNFH